MSTSTTGTSTPDTLTNLLALLPTGTYLAFSTIVPITTNNGNCNLAEKWVTGVMVFIFTFTCAFSSFTDSYSPGDGSLWYGIVTTKGLWNPFFATSGLANVTGWTYTGGGTKYTLKLSDFYVAILSVISFVSLTLLSSNFIDCYYPGLNGTVAKSIPLPVNFFVGLLFSFAPPARHSIGFAFAKTTGSTSSTAASGTTSSDTASTTTTSKGYLLSAI